MKLSAMLPILSSIFGPLILIILWGAWLEYRKPYPEKIRQRLHLANCVITLAELVFVWNGVLRTWMLLPIIVVNGWGYLDAVLRFPIVHEMESFFTLKNILLLAFKVAMLAFGFRRLDQVSSMCIMISLVLVNLLCMPALYLIALPLDDDEIDQRLAAHDAVEDDLAQSALRFLTCSCYRQEKLDYIRKRLYASSQKILESSVGQKVVSVSSPKHRKPMSPLHRRMV
jgi:hypothetical protein